MKAYSSDLRIRALKLMEGIMTQRKVSELLGITVQTLSKWWKLYKDKGIVEPIKPVFTRKRKVDYNSLLEFVYKNPSKTLLEIGKEFKLSDLLSFAIMNVLFLF